MENSIRIALITDGISPYVLGGMQRHSFYLAKYFAQEKIYVDLFHFNHSNLDIEKLECFSAEEKQYIKSIVIDFPEAFKFPGHYIYKSFLYSKRVFEAIRFDIEKYDFIYTKGFSGWKLIREKNKGLSCPPIGINVHGYEMFQASPDFKSKFSLLMLRYFIKPLIFKADSVFSYGGKVTSLLINTVGLNSSKIIEVPGGIENTWVNSSFKQVNRPIKFIFVGRYERRKGVEELNSVLNNIKDQFSFEFTFVGPIPEQKRIIDDKIHYVGEIRDIEIIKSLLFENDVLICPSHSEGMPNVILEAMANQLAIIATDVGAVSMMVDQKNGWLLKNANPNDLHELITNVIITEHHEIKKKQEESLNKVRFHFLWNEIIKQTTHKIKQVI